MAQLPELDYFMEKQAARAAIKNFNVFLQDMFKEYRKVWGMYLNAVNANQKINSKSLNEETSQSISQNDRNSRSTGNLHFEELRRTSSGISMEDSQQQSSPDLISNNESLENINQTFESPIFQITDSDSISNSLNKNVSIMSINESTSGTNNLSNDEGQDTSNETNSAFGKGPTSSVPSIFLSTPNRNQMVNISKKRTVKKNIRSKILTPLDNLRRRNNLSTIRREKALKKTPVKVINNLNLRPKNNSQMNQNNNNLNNVRYNIEITQTPCSKRYKQTKLLFHKMRNTTDSSNDLRSNNTPVSTKTKKLAHNREKVLRQSRLTDMISSKKKETNNIHFNNNYNQSNRCNDAVESTRIENDLICQQKREVIDSMETNDPLNINNESNSSFLPEYENNISLDKNFDISCNSDKSPSPWGTFKSEPESMSQHSKRRKIIHSLQAKENVIDIIDLDEPAEESIESCENKSCKKCKRYEKGHCWRHYSNILIKRETPHQA